jgi:Tfp pilus assembly protein PilF
MKRIDQLNELLAAEPNDTFLLYALALEYQASNEIAETSKSFDNLLANHSHYLPTYYVAANFFAEQQAIEKAKQIYETGIALAIAQRNLKTLAELRGAYTNLLIMQDE